MIERNTNIWKQKLDWIAKKGGMVLLNVHPDYINFDGKKCSIEEYPAEYYFKFLEHVKSEFKGQYWNALPKQLARSWPSLSSKSL